MDAHEQHLGDFGHGFSLSTGSGVSMGAGEAARSRSAANRAAGTGRWVRMRAVPSSRSQDVGDHRIHGLG
ncbi:hypothetical protein Acsp04_60030 [Actinomadura sp. NBRC 104425]|nr:hypothetical protein Acsp04_60030 [Actinomadura sp. NBRC 104425]